MTEGNVSEGCALVIPFNALRTRDHRPLAAGCGSFQTVHAMVVLDPQCSQGQVCGHPRMSDRRMAWYLVALEDLRQTYRSQGGDLIIRVGKPHEHVDLVAEKLGVTAIFGQQAKTYEEIEVRKDIEAAVRNVPCEWVYNDVLIDPVDLPTPATSFPRSFTGFRKKIEARCTVPRPLESTYQVSCPKIDPGSMPTLASLGLASQPIDARSPIANLQGGERGAWRQVEHYIWSGDYLPTYKETRNGMLGWSDSSKLSPYLALGLISPRSVYHQVIKYEQDRIENQSTYWLKFELLWREYFHALGLFCGRSLFLLGGVQERSLQWSHDLTRFDQWRAGRTGCLIVDACMRELAATGYSSNRARQIAASFLVRYLGIDWRWGAAWFEHHLIDYDPCSNWGNWQYLAGIGTDSRDRVFGMRKQAENYDGDAAFVKRWLPECRGQSALELVHLNPTHPDDWSLDTQGNC